MSEVLKFREVLGEYQQEIEIPIEYFDNAERSSFLSDFLQRMKENFGPEEISEEKE